MSNIRFLLIFLGIILGISSCRQDFKQEISFEPLVFQDSTFLEGTILDSTLVMGKSYDIDYYHQYILVAAHIGEREPFIHIFDKSEGKFFTSVLPKGRGPGERLTWGGIQVNHSSGEALFFDSEAQKTTVFQVDSVRHSTKEWKEQITVRKHPVYAYDVIPWENGYIMQGGGEVNQQGECPRLTLFKNDSIVDILYNMPCVQFSESYLSLDKIATDFLYSVSPDRQRIICQITYGMLLEFFSIKDDHIVPGTIRGFIKPLFELDRNKCATPVVGKTMYGLRDLYATNDYIYAIYIGDVNYKNSYRIAVFDWKGNPLHLYITKYRLERLCVDDVDKKIYATGITPQYENVLLKFDL